MKNFILKESSGHLFHLISLNLRKKLEKEIVHLGLTSSHQFGVLLLLSKNSMSQKEISDMSLADEPTASRMLNRMIKNNLITKKRSKDDKRKQVVYLTDKGKELLDKVLPIVQKINQEIKDLLLDEEYNQLLRILNKIYINI